MTSRVTSVLTEELADFYKRGGLKFEYPIKLTVTCVNCDQVKWTIKETLIPCFVCGGKPVTFAEKGIVGGAN